MPSSFTIALASDETYLDGLVGTLSGVARRATAHDVRVVVLDCGIDDGSWLIFHQRLTGRWPKLRFTRLQIRDEQLAHFNLSGVIDHSTNANFARLLLPELLPGLDRIIYLDCDIMVDADLGRLATVNLDGALVGAVAEAHLPKLGQNLPANAVTETEADAVAFNSGLLLMDLAAIRRSDLIQSIVKLPPSFQEKFRDQAALNYLLRGRWKQVDDCWNRQRFVTENFTICRDYPDSLWHFIGKMKPWHFASGSERGLMADFNRDLRATGWIPRNQGNWRPRSSYWGDAIKERRAFCQRLLRSLGRPSA